MKKENISYNDLTNYFIFILNQPKGFIYKKNMEKNIIKTKKEKLKTLYSKHKNCQKCNLCNEGRKQVVFGRGNPETKLLFIGEGPGKNEDTQGLPFVGRSGKLLTKIIESMGLKRSDLFISNVVKCRPPNNRAPLPNESQICKKSILFKEIEIIKPKVICTLGASATKAILGPAIKMAQVRGKIFKFNNILVIPTFHPAYLLRNPSAKKDVWLDMKRIVNILST